MIAVVDINTIWRRKPFEHLSNLIPVSGIAPRRFFSPQVTTSVNDFKNFTLLDCPLPPGWASKLKKLTSILLWRKICLIPGLQGLIVTSPHYLHLVKTARKRFPVLYYCSDDYSQYRGWGGAHLTKNERDLTKLCDHSFFVSANLAAKAEQLYSLDRNHISISPNATDESFFPDAALLNEGCSIARDFPLNRPLVGVVGSINDRLDFELIEACANLPEVGTLVMIGEIEGDTASSGEFIRLRRHSKCLFTGKVHHHLLPIWMQRLDAALIPYRDSPLNRSCSPMRLYDHLASGKPIVSNRVNSQIEDFDQVIHCGSSSEDVQDLLKRCVSRKLSDDVKDRQLKIASQHTWHQRADAIHQTVQRYCRSQ